MPRGRAGAGWRGSGLRGAGSEAASRLPARIGPVEFSMLGWER